MDNALYQTFDELLDAVNVCRGAQPSQPALMPHGMVCTHTPDGPRVEVRRDDLNGPLPSNGHQVLAREQARRKLETIWARFADLMSAERTLSGMATSLHFVANGATDSCAWIFSNAPFVPQRMRWTTVCAARETLRDLIEGTGAVQAYGFFDENTREWMGEVHTTLEVAGVLRRILETQRYGETNRLGQRVFLGSLATTAPSPAPRSAEPWLEPRTGTPAGTQAWRDLAAHHKVCVESVVPNEDGLLLEHGDEGTTGFFLLGNVGDPLGQEAADWVADGRNSTERADWWRKVSTAWEAFWATGEALAPVLQRAPDDPVRSIHTLSRVQPEDRLGIACLGGTLWDPLDLQDVAHLQPGPAWWVRHTDDMPTLLVRTATAQDAATTSGVFLMEGCAAGKTVEVWKPLG